MPGVLQRNGDALALALIVVFGLALRLYFARIWNLSYDEGWHIFAASIEPLHEFFLELRSLTHPPLFYLLARPVIGMGDSVLWPRLCAVVSGTASIIVLHRCCRRIGMASPVALLAAWMLALSYAHLQVSVAVRGYSLAILLLLAAFAEYLHLLRQPIRSDPPPLPRFLGLAALAMWTEYCSGLVIAIMFLVLGMVACLQPGHGKALARLAWQARIACLGFGLSTLTLLLYLGWANGPEGNGHVYQYMPRATESLTAFILRGSTGILTNFTPWRFTADGKLAALLALVAAVVMFFAYRFLSPKSASFDAVKGAVVLMPALLFVLLIVTAILRLYPFGGYLRHQFVLVPFAILSLLTLFDHGQHAMRSSASRTIHCSIAAILLVWAGVVAHATPPEDYPPNPLWHHEATTTLQMMSQGDVLYLTSFNMNGLASELHRIRWRVAGSCGRDCSLLDGEYAGSRYSVIQDRSRVHVPTSMDEAFLSRVTQIMQAQRLAAISILSMQYFPQQPPQTSAAKEVLERHGMRFAKIAQFPEGELLRLSASPPK